MKGLMSVIRNKDTECNKFREYSNRIIRILIEKAISEQEFEIKERNSPCGIYNSQEYKENEFCAVTILRAGNSFLSELMHIVSGIKLGQLLLQRNEESNEKEPIFYYSKLPSDIHTNKVLLCDPMVASGGSMNVAINILLKNGVPLENITVLAVVACPEGLKSIYETHKNVKIICAVVDPVLNSSKYICPGLGDFGDRYFGTL